MTSNPAAPPRLLARLLVAALGALLCAAAPAAAASAPGKKAALATKPSARKAKRRPAPLPSLVWHVETVGGEVVDSHLGEEAVNPASVTKVATTLWALERLGPEFRFETRFAVRRAVNPEGGELAADLLVDGGGDPDFQPENALLVARELNALGIRRVRGALVVGDRFWMGWEDGSAGRVQDEERRAAVMGARLRQAFDPARWNGIVRRAWLDLARRRGFDPQRPPKVTIAGPTRHDGEAGGEALVVHRSRPLADILRRMNAYSNNDIERVGEGLGTPEELGAWLAARLGEEQGSLRFATTSGLGQNRLSPRQMVALLRELRGTCERLGLSAADVLPAAGCDPGTVTRSFEKIAFGPAYATVIGKTGTLTATDGGITVFAGFAHTGQGELIFAVAQPRAAGRLRTARSREQEWVLQLVERHGGPALRACGRPIGWSDEGTDVAPPVLALHAAPDLGRPEPVPAADTLTAPAAMALPQIPVELPDSP